MATTSLTAALIRLSELGWTLVGGDAENEVKYDPTHRFSPYPWVDEFHFTYRSTQLVTRLTDDQLGELVCGPSGPDRFLGYHVHAVVDGEAVCGWAVNEIWVGTYFAYLTDRVVTNVGTAHRCVNCAAIVSGEKITWDELRSEEIKNGEL